MSMGWRQVPGVAVVTTLDVTLAANPQLVVLYPLFLLLLVDVVRDGEMAWKIEMESEHFVERQLVKWRFD